ncbi:MAG: hypothetical protein HF967_08660 [Methanosarcinales archaeon]|nr:hypothetical protein [Methanosarcinales archaeon]
MKEITDIETQPLRIGTAVDVYLTEGKDTFEKQYVSVTRRNLKNPPTDHTQLPNKEYDLVMNICSKVEKQDAFKSLKDHKTQVLLTKKMPELKNYEGACGLLDFLCVNGENAIITDLKTTQAVNPYRYHYTCLDFSYYNQMAMYSLLVKHNYPEVKRVECRHLVVEKTGIYKVQVFILDAERIFLIEDNIESIIREIDGNKDWRVANISWDEAIPIGAIQELNEIL